MIITAACDGSSLGNPGPAGWAWYVDETCWDAGGWESSTNNRGELTAVLELLRATSSERDCELIIKCDSQYVINSLTKWRFGWKQRGWKKKDGKPVLNADLMEELDKALQGREVSFEWVKGHAGHELNEAADIRAREAATAYQNGSIPTGGPGWKSSPSPSVSSSASLPKTSSNPPRELSGENISPQSRQARPVDDESRRVKPASSGRISLLPLLKEDISTGNLEDFLTSNHFPFLPVRAPSKTVVSNWVEEGYFLGKNVESFWIDHSALGPLGLGVLRRLPPLPGYYVEIFLDKTAREKGLYSPILRTLAAYVFTRTNAHRLSGRVRQDNCELIDSFVECQWVCESYERQGWAEIDRKDTKSWSYDALTYCLLRTDWQDGTRTPIGI
ncbi:ribonuclease HI [Actinomycetaceae bacterium TAE3-ERU4]|nr:ribonuclease HI [Actinomycetaceae bacterium TAE3-ERU4]